MEMFLVVSLLQVDLDEPVTLQCPGFWFFFLLVLCSISLLFLSLTLFATRKTPYPLSYEPFMHFKDLVFSNTYEKYVYFLIMLQSSETWRCLCLTLKCLKTALSYQDLTSFGKNQELVGF